MRCQQSRAVPLTTCYASNRAMPITRDASNHSRVDKIYDANNPKDGFIIACHD